MLERGTFGLIAIGSTRERRIIGAVAAVLFVAIFALRTVVEDPSAPIGFLYGIPVTMVALYYSRRVAVAVAALAVALIGVALLHGHVSTGALVIGMIFVPFAAGVARVAAIMREVALKSREAEQRLATIVDTVLEGYVETDADGRITEINEEAQKLFGWPREEILGRDLALTLLPEEARAEFRESIAATLEGREAPLFGDWLDEWVAVRRDGARVTVEWMVAPVCQGGEWEFPIWIFDVTGRVRADEARARLAAIVEHAPEAFVMTAEGGQILAWNPKATEIFGWTEEEAIGRRVDDLILPEHVTTALAQAREQFRQTGSGPGIGERIEFEALRKDGQMFPCEVSISTLETEDGLTFNVFLHDISARRRAEGERQRMASIVEASADAIYSYTLDGTVTSWNPGAERLYGYAAKEIVGTEIGRIVPADLFDDDGRIIDQVRAGERLESYETVRLAKGGRNVDVSLTVSPVREDSGRIVEVAVTARDISEKKRVETFRESQYKATRLLAESEEPVSEIPKLLAILGTGAGWPCGAVWYRDGDDRHYRCATSWENPQLRSDVCPFEVGQAFELHAPPPTDVSWIILTEDGDVGLPGREEAWTAGMRTVLWVPVTIDGIVLGAVQLLTRRVVDREEAMITSTSTVSSLLTELMKRRHAESEAERLKDEFFGMVSHEMRTPLTSIIGYTELLREFESEQLTEQGRGFVEVIERNARREMRLVGDLLALVRIEGGSFTIEPEPVELTTIAREAADAAAPRAEQGKVSLTATLDPLPATRGDPHRLGQVIDNLLSNAIKFTPEGGRVEMRLGHEGGVAILEVEDTGIGIPENEQQKLFDRLYRASSATERHIQGLGLGLTITKAIVEAHDGTIGVRSTEGEGTTFRVELPLREPEVHRPAESPARDRVKAR